MSDLAPVALIVNPVATRAGRGLRGQLARALGPAGLEWALTTRGPGDAGRLARRVADEGARTVVTLGGDGTAADAAGALAGGTTALAPMPGGNANVFARAIGWPARPADAVPLLVAALDAGRVRAAALGRLRADDRDVVFTINAGMGIDAATVEWIEARPRAKRRLRQAGFAAGALVAAARARHEPRLRVAADGGPPVDDALAVLVACGTPYTYLGRRPLDLAPGAAFDGHLGWVALTRARPADLAAVMGRAVRGRDLPLGGPALRGGAAHAEVVVRADGPVAVQADGEPLGRHAELRVTPGPSLRVVDPRGGARLKSDPPRPT
ncbi:diacylglycerol/lipid kinase family protein [Miltoncostaea marina]|uniref:diacylglycerol/lipid kinase family protein n=1 Tax=Miltoncostaea marina TaxID=2843215 RepID=UPI001C3CD83E|nr:diacylglycerol kinase family protein [Miltoncostaea marina]